MLKNCPAAWKAAALCTALLTPALMPASALAAPTSSGGLDSQVVGSVGSYKVTWGQFITEWQKTNPPSFHNAIMQVTGDRVATDLFGGTPKAQSVMTRSSALTYLYNKPTQEAANQLNVMLQQEVIRAEAAKQGVSATDAQADAQLAVVLKRMRTQGNLPPTITDDQFLAQQKVTRAQVRSIMKQQVLLSGLVEKELAKKLGHSVTPADFVQARHILIAPVGVTPETKPEEKAKLDADALAKVNAIAADIKSGKITFDAAAKANSDDPGSKESGGSLGVFLRGIMVPAFDAAAFTQKENEVGAPVQSKFGYHVILVEKRGAEIPAEERQLALENYKSQQTQQYLPTLIVQYKMNNSIADKLPPMMMPGGPRPR